MAVNEAWKCEGEYLREQVQKVRVLTLGTRLGDKEVFFLT